jgi:AraC-like DNA-binding protein
MCSFTSISPMADLQSFVEQFILYEANSGKAITQNLIPSNMQYLGFVLQGDMQPFVSSTFDPPLAISKSYIIGQLSRPFKVTYPGNLKILAIHFKPTAMYQLFGIPMYHFTNQVVAFETIAEIEGQTFIEEILGACCVKDQVAIAERFLLQKTKQKNFRHAKQVEYACNLIQKQHGNIRLKYLLEQVNMCERNFARCFLEKVGISPKTFISIARINKALQLIESVSAFKWTDFAYQLNYVDQAHFNHDFKKFSGNNPTQYYYSRTDFEHFLYRR